MNNVQLIGRVTKDIEVRKTPSNKSVANFTLAVDDGYGENKKAQFINCVAWEKSAETIAKYVHKGDMFGVTGKLVQKNTEKNGEVVNRSYEVVVNGFTFLPNAKKEQQQVDPFFTTADLEEDLPF